MKSLQVSPYDTNMAKENKYKVSSSLCKTFLFFIRVSGLFAGRKFGSLNGRRCNTFLEVLLSVVANLMILGYTILLTTNFWRSDNLGHGTIIRSIAFQFFMCGVLLFSITMSCHLPNVLVHFEKCLEVYEEEFYFSPQMVSFVKRMQQIKYFVIASALTISVTFMVILYTYISISKFYFPTYNFSSEWHISTFVFYVITHMMITCQSLTSLMFYMAVSYFAVAEFNRMSKEIEESMMGTGSEIKLSIEFFYNKHEAICQLIDVADQCFRPFLLLLFVIYLPVSCIVFYAFIMEDIISAEAIGMVILMIWSSLSGIFFILFAGGFVSSKLSQCWIQCPLRFILMMSSSFCGIFLFAGGFVRKNAYATSMAGHLWNIKPSVLSERDLHTLSLFTSKLCGQSIGFSLYGVFTINMSAILTIFGTVMAYFVVIIQFKPSGCEKCHICNYTTPQ